MDEWDPCIVGGVIHRCISTASSAEHSSAIACFHARHLCLEAIRRVWILREVSGLGKMELKRTKADLERRPEAPRKTNRFLGETDCGTLEHC